MTTLTRKAIRFTSITLLTVFTATALAGSHSRHKLHDAQGVYEGFGSQTSGGEFGETCQVNTLRDSSRPGSLRYCIRNRNKRGADYIPRKITFNVAGEIRLQNDLVISTPYLTIDGFTAPSPGITIRKKNLHDGEVIISTNGPSSGHDIILRYLRFDGEWNFVEFIDNHSATLAIDGEDEANAVYNLILDHLTLKRSTDSGPDMWGDIKNVTIQWCLIFDSLHPMTISHSGGRQARHNISLHHNIFARNHERNPQIRGKVYDLDYRNNIVYQWKRFEGGYGVRLRPRNGVFPSKINFVGNFFYSDNGPDTALVFGDNPNSPAARYPGEIYLGDNYLPANNHVKMGTVSREIPIPASARVLTSPVNKLAQVVLPTVGTRYRTKDEQSLINEIKQTMHSLFK